MDIQKMIAELRSERECLDGALMNLHKLALRRAPQGAATGLGRSGCGCGEEAATRGEAKVAEGGVVEGADRWDGVSAGALGFFGSKAAHLHKIPPHPVRHRRNYTATREF